MENELLPVPPLGEPAEDFAYGKYRVAMVIDGDVHQILTLTAEEAARYLSEPVFVQIPRSLYVATGDHYIDNKFVHRK